MSAAVEVWASRVPGAPLVRVTILPTVAEAWEWARSTYGHRRDISRHDVRLEVGGRIIGYAGPQR